ncbi:MAG: phenylacetone monooxygenase [Actinomycetota bacterium]|jgi:cyclohexanone monooxygenase
MERSVDIAVVGAGFAGMYMVHRARAANLSVQVFEAGTDVGGTWYWNRYPGARCDIESVEYSYSFDNDLQQQWEWNERYAGQPEILTYAQHVADRFDLRRDIQFSTRVTSAIFNEKSNNWRVTTDQGDVLTARFVVFATGCLSSTNVPHFVGADSFTGATYHTGEWPHEGVDFTGKSVGLIGTGSSAIQSIPIIAAQAKHLTVFQRTATYSVPARNDTIDKEYVKDVKANYKEFRDLNRQQMGAFGSRIRRSEQSALEVSETERRQEFERRWEEGGFAFLSSYNDFLLNNDANETVAEFVREKIYSIIKDPETAKKLLPQQVIGCKRLCLDSGYYETFNRPNVSLVDVSTDPIERITENGLVAGGEDHTFDVLVYATGFDAMTGSLLKIDIRGRNNQPLAEAWDAGPVTYLGLSTAGFPNMFMVSGPGSPSVLTNMIMSIEQHVEWISDCISHIVASGKTTIETTETEQTQWVAFVNAVADMTLYPSCNSWYLGANVPGKPRVFMPLLGFPTYADKCSDVAAKGYEGFVLA